MRTSREALAEWFVYLAVVAAILSAIPMNAVAIEEVEVPKEPPAPTVEFHPQDLLATQVVSIGLRGRLSVGAEVGEPVEIDPLGKYRGRTERFSHEELRDLLELIGFRGTGLRSAWAVAMRESTGDPLAHNTNASTEDNSYGLFQINMYGTLEEYRRSKFDLPSNEVLFDPVLNAEIAFILSREGTDFGHWNVGPNAYRGDGSPPGYERWLPEYPEE